MDTRTEVIINGEIVPIRSGESMEYLQKVAHFTGIKINEVTERYSKKMISDKMRTLLIALNIADEYFKVEPQLTQLKSEQRRNLRELVKLQEENIRLTQEVHRLQRELNHTRAELDDFIDNFDESHKIVPLHDMRKTAVS